MKWSDQEKKQLANLYATHGPDWTKIGQIMGRSYESVRWCYRIMLRDYPATVLEQSPYPRYDQPLIMEGDALVLPDLELPFHHAEFVNRCLELAEAWGVRQLIIAGDMLHLDSISKWEANWVQANGKGGLDEDQELLFVEFAKTLGSRQQERAFDLLDKIGTLPADGDPNVSEELRVARRAVRRIADRFDRVDIVIGNHDGRLLNALASPMFPEEIIRLVEAPKATWRIAPYYYSLLVSNGHTFRVEHPKSAAKYAAEKLAAKFHQHVLMAHSHALRFNWDISGVYYAIQIGCCVDEMRLPYAAQRSTPRDAHKLGAVIVRNGYPWLLHIDIPWQDMMRLI